MDKEDVRIMQLLRKTAEDSKRALQQEKSAHQLTSMQLQQTLLMLELERKKRKAIEQELKEQHKIIDIKKAN